MGGGFGLFLWARDGEEPLFVPQLLEAVVVVDELEEDADDDELVGEAEVCTGVGVEEAEVVVAIVDMLSDVPLELLIRSDMIALLFTSQLLGEFGGEVEVGEAEAELELATELQLPVFLDKSVGSFSLAAAEAWWWW